MNPSPSGATPFDPFFASPFITHLGVEFGDYGDGWAEVILPLRPEFLNSIGTVGGGVYAALVDCALARALMTRIPPGQGMVTSDLSCRYLRSTRVGPLRGRGRVIDIGKRLALAEADIYVANTLLVKGSGAFMLVSGKTPRSMK